MHSPIAGNIATYSQPALTLNTTVISRFSNGLRSVFFKSTCAIWMHLNNRAVHGNGLDLDTDELRALQFLKYPIQHAFFCPAVQSGINGMPITKTLRQCAPLTTVLGDVANGIQHVQAQNIAAASHGLSIGRSSIRPVNTSPIVAMC